VDWADVRHASRLLGASLPAHHLPVLDTDMITMFDNAFKQQPGNEELGVQTFFANVRTGRWKEAQQVSQVMLA
jgi:hypothetical protein